MMLNELTLYDVCPSTWTSLWISYIPCNWTEDETVDEAKVDSAYLYGHSGNKIISPFTEHFLDENDKLTDSAIHAMADILYQIFGESWNRLWEINKAEFDPLENYRMTEEEDTTPTGTETEEVTKSGTETDTLTKSGTETETYAKSGTETDTLTKSGTTTNTSTDSGKETLDRTHTGSDTVRTLGTAVNNVESNSVFGFNSSTAVPADEKKTATDTTVTTTPGATDKEEKTFTNRQTQDVETFTNRQDANTKTFTNRQDTDTKSFTNRQDQNTKSFTGRKDTKVTSFDERNTHRALTRAGNVGITTSQQMAESSLKLWQWKFWLQVFDDIDSFLCCSVY